MEKIEKKINIETFDISDFDGKTLDDVIEMFEDCKDEEYTRYTVTSNMDYDGEDSSASVLVYGYRMETDIELEKRMNDIAKVELNKYLALERRKQADKELYLKLKAEFGE